MRKIEFYTGGSHFSSHDAAIVLAGEDPREALIEAVIQGISTDLMVTVADVTMHLAAWQDPDHWAEDWAEKGIDAEAGGVDELVADAIAEANRA